MMIIQRWEEPDNDHHLKTGVIWLNRYSTYPAVGDANSTVGAVSSVLQILKREIIS